MPSPIYILSTGRTATNYLHRYIQANCPGFELTHQGKWSRILNMLGNLLLCPWFSNCSGIRIYRFLRKERIPASTADPLLSVILCKAAHAGALGADYKMIHIIRDPRTFATSFMNWKRQKWFKFIQHHLIPFWNPEPLFTGHVSFFKWLTMSKFEHFCLVWKIKNEFFIRQNKDNPNYLLVKMEDMTGDNGITLEKIINFTGFHRNVNNPEQAKKMVNKSDKDTFPHWKQWNKTQAITLQHHCKDLMQQLQYGTEKEWTALIQ